MQPQKKKNGIIKRIYNAFYPLRLAVRTALVLIAFYAIMVSVPIITHNGNDLVIIMGAELIVMAGITAHYTYHKLGWEKRSEITSNINEMLDRSPYEFEQTVANLMQKMGYSAKLTTKSDGEEGGDYGSDIIAKKDGRTVVVQVKRWATHSLVGAPDVRSVLGCLHTFKASKAILVTTSDFTEQAYEQAKGAPIELWNGAHLSKLMAKYA